MDWIVLGIIVGMVAFAVYYPQIPLAATVYRRFRRPQKLTCPARGTKTLVKVAAGQAALTTLVSGSPHLRVKDCARWPDGKRDCKRDCLAQVA